MIPQKSFTIIIKAAGETGGGNGISPSEKGLQPMNRNEIAQLEETLKQQHPSILQVYEEMAKVIVGQKPAVESFIIGLITRGHILIEGVPGLAKTMMIKTLADIIDTGFQRIQFTPDLLPADLIGTTIYNPREHEFTIKKGPIFSNLILADEINRAPAKVQSALLEAMQERQVTIGAETFRLDEPFMVMATQNPVEQEGTYALPEAQVDRFMMKIKITYPSPDDELEILNRMTTGTKTAAQRALTPADVGKLQDTVLKVYVDEKIKRYILNIVFATRFPENFRLEKLRPLIAWGASPRATIALTLAAKAKAFLQGRAFVIPDDVKEAAPDVLRHRLIVTYEAEAEEKTSDDILQDILSSVVVP